MSSRNLIFVIVTVVLLGVGYFLFTQTQKQPMTTPSTETAMPTETPTATSGAQTSEVREITVDGDEFKFTPASLSLMAGEKVRLTFNNKGKFPHNLTIDELGVATKTIKPGGTDGIEFTVSKTGNFEMYCSVGNHRAQGMEGTVEVK